MKEGQEVHSQPHVWEAAPQGLIQVDLGTREGDEGKGAG